MSVVSNNPYQSPKVGDQLEASPAPAETGLVATTIFGIWAGVTFGGTFGIGGSLMLLLTRGPLLGWDQLLPAFVWTENSGLVEYFLLSAARVAVLGLISGVACGLLIGPFVGFLSAAQSGRFRHTTVYAAIGLSAVAGAMIGHFGCKQIVVQNMIHAANSHAEFQVEIALLIGTLIGGVTGVLGGRILGRGILAFGDGTE